MWKLINLKFDDECNSCGVKLPKGIRAVWQGKGRVICTGCVSEGGQGKDEDCIFELEDYPNWMINERDDHERYEANE